MSLDYCDGEVKAGGTVRWSELLRKSEQQKEHLHLQRVMCPVRKGKAPLLRQRLCGEGRAKFHLEQSDKGRFGESSV